MTDVPPPPPPGGLTPPPGFVAYGSAGAVIPGIQPIKGISKALAVITGLQVPLQLVSALLTWNLANKAADRVAGLITDDEFRTATQSPLITITSLLFLPTAVLTIVWMYRMAANLKTIGRPNQRWSPAWAISGWFLPPCGVYAIPWLVFRELWRGSDPDVPAHDESWRTRPVTPLIQVWWVLYGLVPLVGLATSVSVFNQMRANDDLLAYAEQLDKYAVLNVSLALVSTVAAAVYFVIVRRLSARHMATTHES